MNQIAIPLELPATPAESRAARDRGIKRTESANAWWIKAALEGLKRFAIGRADLTLEEFRHWWLAQGGAVPSTHHAYGALAQQAVRSGLLQFTTFENARSVKTHGHPVRRYRVIGK